MNWPGFANPWMLAAAAAVGLPVLIHFLTRARPRRIAFPPYRFLLEACAGQQAIHRLRTIVVLALRALAVLALVLMFARPFLKPTGATAAAAGTQRVVLILDASLSMRAVQRGVTLFGRAQAEAADALRALESGSEAAVILAGSAPRPLLPALSRNLPALHEALVQAQPTFEKGDPAAALALARQLLGGKGIVYIFSDFQKTDWDTVQELPAGLTCRLRPVTTTPVDNLAITATRLSPSAPVVGEPTEVVVTVFNGTSQPREETVRLELGQFAQERRVALVPFGAADAVFVVSFAQPGDFAGTATIEPDDLREDNRRFLAVRVHKALQLLLVSDAEAAERRSGAFFVERALAPSAAAAPGLHVVRRHGQDTDRGVLETADVFVLVAPATLTGEATEIIARRVSEGGNLIVFFDGPAAAAVVPTAFGPPFRLRRSVTSDPGVPVRAGARRLFADTDGGDWSGVRFRRHYETELLDGREADVVLAYPDGSAALTLSALGKGAVVFANLPVTPDSGDLVGHPMFPSLLQELLRALRRGAETRAVTPGAAWTLEAPTAGEAALAVSTPDGQPVPAQVLASGRTTRLALPAVRAPGLYPVRQGETVLAFGVVNVDPRESDTRPIALENLRPGAGASVSVARNEEELQLAGQSRPLWPQLAALAAGLIGLEMLLLALWRTKSEKRP